ncbi:MAG: anion permease [Candidatus Portnoybacteria bacterium CG_4_8_14_3_um_filter_44_10]|uniref:Anion permease n=5 Tax=Candidatus Portnoyibacteriota TaxID=1817913 RepID=A0A2H0KP36_9BACT|nr:MAG: anion permease [Candidatus Portnoybacteria bacterium CG11_big_fil_rev_8_21_14_0_20_44_10]PIS16928.1 MAG: anion permease [Candidatus Portnoybacteria bacterium CG09_land_8_20_14_0_10_44_13]PIW75254.1 MAG: anion permease [Candidatus Portnoybacteria bacterium CG_4_8_14_3_um_filter_44_10]PIZ70536.1 MAG: anion permease [Candidatus Portnoybacteria bacterium CG_4_10_14_0_2_um_filter_44_20]PJA63198.1 MAG: anion permease [Candidatus Portnoybacteria bacterium CG_4_9_14_3_um_filter_44_9]
MLDPYLLFIIFIIAVALVFDFTNGMHDSANAIATVVSTRVLSPRQAVVWAAFFNFIAFLVFGTAVAKTIGNGMVDLKIVTPVVILVGLIGTISWNLITWWLGLPSSSSHALIGGYAGAAIAKGGFGVLILSGWYKILIFIVIAPLIGLFLAIALKIISSWVVYKKAPLSVNIWSRRLQLVSAALYSLAHGGNDAQKTMGIITGLLVSGGLLHEFNVPLWVVLISHGAIALGTFSGGWRIVKTVGQKITKLRPIDGFCAEGASAISIFLSTHLGVPVSTTHVITGAISGVGSVNRLSAVRWGITLHIVWAWLLTIPASAIMAGVLYYVLERASGGVF